MACGSPRPEGQSASEARPVRPAEPQARLEVRQLYLLNAQGERAAEAHYDWVSILPGTWRRGACCRLCRQPQRQAISPLGLRIAAPMLHGVTTPMRPDDEVGCAYHEPVRARELDGIAMLPRRGGGGPKAWCRETSATGSADDPEPMPRTGRRAVAAASPARGWSRLQVIRPRR